MKTVELIKQWQDQHDLLLTEYGKGNTNNEVMQMYRSRMKDILLFINQLQQVKEAQSKELTDILECIAKFDQNESLAHKGMYFNTIQKDVINYLKSKV